MSSISLIVLWQNQNYRRTKEQLPEQISSPCSDLASLPDLPELPVRPTRKNCMCYETKDIGNFDTCDNDCLYCSANRQIDKEASVVVRIEPKSVRLWPEPLEMPIPPK